ncbi:MAG: transcription-repair coupling factor [Cardiobacteriaceae bacterium]|nr:transcription-repair coupling factor [Cardiobacteriaceae bacterium]
MNLPFLPYNLHQHLSGKHIHLLIAPDARWAEYWYENLKYWTDDHDHLYWFSDWETLPYDQYTPHPELIAERLRVLAELPTRKHGILITSVAALRQRLCPQAHLDRYGIHLSIGDRLERQALIRRLQEAGYQHNPHISCKGEYATRGNIIDLYPMNAADPIRLEWFDDNIDSIRTFAIDSQLTLEKKERISILPRNELDLSDSGRTCFRQNIRRLYGEKITNSPLYRQISEGHTPQGLEYYLPLFYDDTATLFDYLPTNTRSIVCDDLANLLEQHAAYCNKRYQRTNPLREHHLLPPEQLWFSAEETLAHLARIPAHPYPEKAESILFSGSNHEREEHWQNLIAQHKTLTLHFASNGLRETWQERLGARCAHLNMVISPNRHSFRDGEHLHLAESDLHTTPPSQNYRQNKNRNPASIIRSLQDLADGAAVVHIDYGIGRYRGLHTLENEELLLIEYAKGAKLYVPISDLDLISRYGGNDPENAPLHELGGKSWRNSQRKIAVSLRDTAAELLALYAKRETTPGISIAHDPQAAATLAAEFPFEETPDQTAAIAAVLNDLARPQPMDRIICGDVGFGKTEVAVRAIYAAAIAGYQTALIAPTTLLAEQHYHNLQDRFANHPITIESISRFKSASAAKKTLERLKDGKIDLIIGTHRLLQKDVAFKNLGLVIIDEEQRFGVRHKEKLKSLRTATNLLTLTATPIPRTLNLALSGLRDISIIATPPAGRQNIQTILSEWDIDTIHDACEREHRRGGQTYILHNDIDSIEHIARLIQDTLPEQRIAIAHGQMRERELEHLMQNFQNRHYDILIATTIIESGIDIPNANTIIINRADKLGLSQLHQLRGRVGRSHHQAYAYLITPNWNTLGKDAQRRLDAFTTLDSLGAGFLLASQDLEIRGAGEILGDEQSGQIQQIGISYYLDLLERTIEALKNGQTFDPDSAPSRSQIDLGEPALLPDAYIHDPQERLVIYQRLAQSKNEHDLQQISSELIDRFGKLPTAAQNLIHRSRLKQKAEQYSIDQITLNDTETRIHFTDPTRINPEPLLKHLQCEPHHYKLSGNSAVTILYHEETPLTQRLEELETLLGEIST